jgi:hypothetical protein
MDFDSIPIELQSRSDAELAALLPHLTSGPIKVSRVIEWLRETESNGTPLAFRVAFGASAFEGVLPALAQDGGTAPAVKQGLNLFFGHLLSGDSELSTNGEKYAMLTAQVMAYLKGAGIVQQSDIDAFYSLDGGRPWKDITVGQIASARSTKLAKEAFQLKVSHIENEFLNGALTNLGSDVSKALADAKTWWDAN